MRGAAVETGPLRDAEWPGEIDHLLGGFAGKLNIYRVMARHPELLAAWETLRNHVVLGNALAPQQLEAVILRAGHRWQSPYELAHHVVRGGVAGLSETDIEAARAPAQAWGHNTAHRRLMSAVDDLLDTGRLSESSRVDLEKEIGLKGIFDLMATVGMYTTLAFVANSFEVPIDADISAPSEAAAVAPEDHGQSAEPL